MSKLINRNRVMIDLVPNNYYTQLPKSARDMGVLIQISIAPMQIKKLEIFKSYLYHVTDTVVEIDHLDPNIAAYWGEGKYIAHLTVVPMIEGDADISLDNYFVCYDMKVIDTPPEARIFSTTETVSVRVILKSITRTRLESENNFTFELGGKNGKGAAGFGQSPIQFLHSDLMEMYNRNYMEEGGEAIIPWNMEFCDLIEPVHQIHTTPSNGYKIITDNNMEALAFFFIHYPVFNTIYDWVLDDCSTDGTVTELRISDFTWWPAWEHKIDINLSNILNQETKGKAPTKFRSAAAMRMFKIQILESVSYHDWVVFYVENGYPKIWAEDVSSGKPIPMVAWNAIHEEAPVLTPSGRIKIIPNPMYQEYLTFMTPKEIKETQLFKGVFQNLHPLLEKYTFANVFVGDVDIHTVIELKLDTLGPTARYDRLGMGYQVLHTYTRDDLQPAGMTGSTSTALDESPITSQYAYSHNLTSEVIFLTIDKGELNIPEMGNEDTINVSADPANYAFTPTDACGELTDFQGNAIDGGGGGGTDGRGLPGNTSIADQGQAMINHGFFYTWGGKGPISKGIDCSGFTSLAVKRAGIGGYPHGTANQKPWCDRGNAQRIDKPANAKRGDILFFSWKQNGHFGHTGIAINSSQYIHSSGGRSGGVGAKTSTFANYGPRKVHIYRLKEGS